MGKFFLIDQSLKSVGGHHYDYSNLVSRAAVDAGWTVVVACHRKFKEVSAFHNCAVRNWFRLTTYASCSDLVGIQDMVSQRNKPNFFKSLCQRLGFNKDNQVDRQRNQEKRIQTFREDCHAVFTEQLSETDVIFFTTLSDLEAQGLYQFLQDRPDAKLANWHLQFHFPLFRGRTPQYQEQVKNISLVQDVFDDFNTLTSTNIRFYVTSETLKDQYEHTGYPFESLTYPVNPNLKRFPGTPYKPQLKANLTFAGSIRKEKGGNKIDAMINGIEQDFGDAVCFSMQRKKPKLITSLWQVFKRQTKQPNLIIHQYPLTGKDYLHYIRNSDIGLLTTYESETYFSRRAGILGEYLTAGIPVIVPAGCWLSDQIEIHQQAYLKSLVEENRPNSFSVRANSTLCQAPGKTTVNFTWDTNPTTGDFRLVILEFDVVKPSEHGNYLRVVCQQKPETGKTNSKSQIIGQDRIQSKRYVAFYVNRDQNDLDFEITPAFGSREGRLENIRATQINDNKIIPRSVVGLIAETPGETVDLASEMIQQYNHYRNSALELSSHWFHRHDPDLTFRTLVKNSGLPSNSSFEKAA
ncbi:MAG: hypothetical protein VX438_10050 [Planctomycetota bacterium]|nr:hypothetical protein [Planctomycetota bacterium]